MFFQALHKESYSKIVLATTSGSYSFCGSGNRIRLTPKGLLKTCLYDEGVLDIRQLLRAGATDVQLQAAFLSACSSRAKDGHEAERKRKAVSESMATIGG